MKASPGKAQNLFERQIISEGQQKVTAPVLVQGMPSATVQSLLKQSCALIAGARNITA